VSLAVDVALRLARPLLARNTKFKGRHAGETCYIIGNGASLKQMELSAFSDRVAIGLNLLCVHKDFRSLNIPYLVVPEPFFFYRYVRNPYTGQHQRNIIGQVIRESLREYSDIALFTSVSNLLGRFLRNTYYLHHFGNREVDRRVCDISGAFSFMAGSFYTAIGLAMNLGFTKAILVGCDYTFSPIQAGHFYARGPAIATNEVDNLYERLFAEAAPSIELSVVTTTGETSWLPHQSYESLTGRALRYRENTEIVRLSYLRRLEEAVRLKQYSGRIFPAGYEFANA
jgi:hypothetical protein